MENLRKMRKCIKCNKEKSADKFNKDGKRCISCQGIYMCKADAPPEYKHRDCLKCGKNKYIQVPYRLCETCTQDNANYMDDDYAVLI